MTTDISDTAAPAAFDNESELIQRLYGSLVAREGFDAFLQLLGNVIGASACTLSCVEREPLAIRYLWHTGLPESFVEHFLEQGMLDRDVVFNSAARRSPTGFLTAPDALHDLQQQGRADFWSESYEMSLRLGFQEAAWMVVHAVDDSVIVLSLMRAQGASKYTVQELDKANRLVPHIRQAFQLYEQVDRQNIRASSLGAVLDAVTRPSIILSELSHAIHINRSAGELLQGVRELSIVNDRIRFRDKGLQTEFSHALTDVLRSSIRLAPFHSESLYLPRDQRHDLILCLTPIENIDDNQAGALLTLIDPEKRELPDSERIAEYFSLTPAEAALCADLVLGDSLKEIAARRHKSESTLRSYLKQIYQKTGYRRQGQLVSGILSALIE
jgi:DNA-binding CsgD family transcriptional regulator